MDFAFLITAYLVFVYSTVAHEAAHALVALKLGDRTAYLGGQVTLDPTPHIKREPMGMVLFPLLSLFNFGGLMGWASAPLDPLWVTRHPRRSALVAIAGPIANFLLCGLAILLMFIGAKNGVFVPTDEPGMQHLIAAATAGPWEVCAQILSIVFTLNLLLGVFNLLPLPPLDGSNIPLFFLQGRAAERYQEFLRQPWLPFLTLVLAFYVFRLTFRSLYQWSTNELYRLLFG